MSQASFGADREKLFDEFNRVVAETEKLLKTAAGGDAANAAQEGVEQGIAKAAALLEKLRQEAVGQASAAARATDEYVVENPWRAIGIAAAVAGLAGLVAGLLASRR